MKINKVLNDYQKLKKTGTVSVETTNQNRQVLVVKKYSQYTGEVIGQNMISIDKKAIDSQIKELEEKIESLKLLKKDLK